MKQAKFVLTATVVLAIVGGAIAFKSRTNGVRIFKQTTTTGPCDQLQAGRYLTTTAATATTVSFATVATTNPCPLVDKTIKVE